MPRSLFQSFEPGTDGFDDCPDGGAGTAHLEVTDRKLDRLVTFSLSAPRTGGSDNPINRRPKRDCVNGRLAGWIIGQWRIIYGVVGQKFVQSPRVVSPAAS
ncbi:hypothetical protein [Qipengyuania sp. NPDC077563]|uniref:hypothetical protein n=1 Tax=Qipengyuania sp. NPDC077563 TaxID=3364497 RepID=UPI00384D3664